MKFNTKVIHGGQQHEKAYGSVMPPIYQTSTYAQSLPGKHKGYEYSRTHNPTRTALQDSIISLENGKHGLAFASGMAAIDTVAKLLKTGDEVISVNNLYGGTYRIFDKVYQQLGIKTTFIDLTEASNLENYISKNTKLVWIETPTNPMMTIVDIKAISDITKQNNIILAVDNTFATPYLQKPLDLGADIVVHSATKYLGGHSDTVLGLAVVNSPKIHEKLEFIQNASGAVPGPFDCFMVLRGIKTLGVRMQRHCENGEEIARYLTTHPSIKKVYWPGFDSHPNHQIAKQQMSYFGGMLSFVTKEDSKKMAFQILEKFECFILAESLGGVESLVGHPASMTHASIPKEIREQSGVSDGLIRLSVGIEDVEDLIKDLEKALS